VCSSGKNIRFSDIEYRILVLLINKVSQPIRAEEIIRAIWLDSTAGNKENLKVQIRKIRKRIETDPGIPKHLLSIHGVGYILWINDYQK